MDPTADRPAFPPSYGVDRAPTGGMLSWEAVGERMACARNYWITSASPDGRPHAAPVWGIWLDGGFLFATDPASRKGRNLTANPIIAVHLESGDDVVIFEGTAEPVAGASLLGRFAEAYDAKYGFRVDVENATSGIYRLRPRVAFAWLERDFLRTATRFHFDT